MTAPPSMIRPTSRLLALFALGALGAFASSNAAAQEEPTRVQVTGVIADSESGEPVSLAEVRLLLRPAGELETVTSDEGLFSFEAVPLGEHRLVIRHLTYGEHEESVEVEEVGEGARIHLDMEVSPTAISLAPFVVEVLSRSDREARARGHRANVVERAEIEAAMGGAGDLSDLLRDRVPGVRVQRSGVMGTVVCIEFRGVRRGPGDCDSPAVFIDGVRVSRPTLVYGVLPLTTIERLEVLPPAEAGVRYGSAASSGALLIESRRPGSPQAEGVEEPHLRMGEGRFDWSVEPEPHASSRVFVAALSGNAAGLYLGSSLARQCFSRAQGIGGGYFLECSPLAGTVTAVGAVLLPPLLGGLGGRLAGATPLSRGEYLPTVASGALGILPGAFLAVSTSDGAHRPAGLALMALAAPLAHTVADRIYRSFR